MHESHASTLLEARIGCSTSRRPGDPIRAGAPAAHLRRAAQARADTIARLNALGIGRNDRVAIVLPNGPEMAAAFIAIARGRDDRAAQPGLPRRRVRVLPDRPARQGAGARRRRATRRPRRSPRSSACRSCGSRRDADAPAGQLPARGRSRSARRRMPGPPQPDDIALVLHTSGTTSRPKIVPLTQRNVAASAQEHPRDAGAHAGRPLPQHHAALPHPRPDRRGAVVALGRRVGHLHAGLQRAEVLPAGWMRRSRPGTRPCRRCTRRSWRARRATPRASRAAKLRFIRSSSSSLPPQVMAELEAAFGCPVIEAYGMTEAAHQMASNPLPPGARKPGSVGVAAGPEVAIMATDGSAARRRTRSARSSSAGRTSRPATRTTRRPTPRPSRTAGSAPATRARWTPRAMSASPGG